MVQQLAEFFRVGGPFMYVNLFCLVIALAIVVERSIFFMSKGSVNTRAFLEQIRKLVAANNVDRAIKLCSATEAPVARVAKAGLGRLPRGEAAITTAIEETMVDVTPDLKKRIGALWSLANIATLFGLLGTIMGLIHAFHDVAKAPADQKATMLAGSISEAMSNTALGLGIAVFCMIGHVILNSASKKQQQDLEAFSLKLENLLSETQTGART